MRHAILAFLSIGLAACESAPTPAPPPPVTVRVPCVAEELKNPECRPTPTGQPATRVELEDSYDELGVSNTACYAIVTEYAAAIAECNARREEN